jgi:hypothetical protein
MSEEEKKVFDQEVSLDELDAVAGGVSHRPGDCASCNKCTGWVYRDIYGDNGFPNCAATVESGSHCDDNDACWQLAIKYNGMNDCSKAWR